MTEARGADRREGVLFEDAGLAASADPAAGGGAAAAWGPHGAGHRWAAPAPRLTGRLDHRRRMGRWNAPGLRAMRQRATGRCTSGRQRGEDGRRADDDGGPSFTFIVHSPHRQLSFSTLLFLRIFVHRECLRRTTSDVCLSVVGAIQPEVAAQRPGVAGLPNGWSVRDVLARRCAGWTSPSASVRRAPPPGCVGAGVLPAGARPGFAECHGGCCTYETHWCRRSSALPAAPTVSPVGARFSAIA